MRLKTLLQEMSIDKEEVWEQSPGALQQFDTKRVRGD